MFCVKCGLPAAAENLCERHFLERNNLFEIDSFSADFCRQCQNFHKGPVEEQIRNAIRTKHKITGCDIRTKRVGNRLLVSVACSGYIRPLKNRTTEKKNSIVLIRNKKCGNCIKVSGGYYEAVLQARGERLERIMNKMGFFLPSEAVVSISKLKEGYDVRIMDKKIAAKAATRLGEYFDIKTSYKLVGEKKGKKLYRNFYAIR